MVEFILMVVLLQPSSDVPETRWVVVSSFSVSGLTKNGCYNAQNVLDAMGKEAKFAVASACIPKHVANLDVEKK